MTILLFILLQSFNPVQAATPSIPLRVGIPHGQEAYIDLHEGQPAGVEGRLLHQALLRANFKPSYLQLPSLRVIEQMKRGDLDATINVSEGSLPEAFPSSFTYDFENCLVTMVKRKIKISGPDDLKGLRVVAFKNAHVSLDSERYQKARQLAKSYLEIQEVDRRLKMLTTGRADVMLSDRNILNYYIKKEKNLKTSDFELYCPYGKTSYHLIFRNKSLRDHFEGKSE